MIGFRSVLTRGALIKALTVQEVVPGDFVVPVHEDLPSRGLTHAFEPAAPQTVNGHVPEDEDGVLGSDHLLPVREDLVGHLVSRPEGSAKGLNGLGVTQVEVRPDPDPSMVILAQRSGSHPTGDTQHVARLAPVDVWCDRRLEVFLELRLIELLEGQCIHRQTPFCPVAGGPAGGAVVERKCPWALSG